MTTSRAETSTACSIRAPKNVARGSGVPSIRLSTSESRWNVIATATLLKQTVMTASATIEGT